jgi:hypothetical protein
MKREVDTLDATPDKRVFLSIIADYSLQPGICELIDNAIDAWKRTRRKSPLRVTLDFDLDKQVILIEDNAGGVAKEDLKVIVGPGLSTNKPTDPSIGIFGVGSKRAVVALAERTTIQTRHSSAPTYAVELDDDWLKDTSWELSVYEVDAIPNGTTRVWLRSLRNKVERAALDSLQEHLEYTYARYIEKAGLQILMPGVSKGPLQPRAFADWAFPKGFQPSQYSGKILTPKGEVNFAITAGLSTKSSATGEFGVTLFCNDRMVFRNKTDHAMGYGPGLAGQPHVSISLAHTVLELTGAAESMPWNSTKTDVNMSHEVYQTLRGQLHQIVKEYASLSRRLQGNWKETVRPFKKGKIKEVVIEDLATRKKFLPELPPAVTHYDQKIRKDNSEVAKEKPWTQGLEDAMVAAELIHRKQRLSQGNRIALIILDSTLEIAFKEYLVHEARLKLGPAELVKLFQHRHSVLAAVEKNGLALSDSDRKKHDFYYGQRCKLIHETATATISDDIVRGYQKFVAQLLAKMFGLNFDAIIGV